MADPKLAQRFQKDLERERDALRRRLEVIERTLDDLVVLRQAGTADTPKKPGTTEAVLSVLRGKGQLADQQVLDELIARRWAPESDDPLNALRATLNRLARIGQLIKDGQTYCLPDEHPKVARLPRARG